MGDPNVLLASGAAARVNHELFKGDDAGTWRLQIQDEQQNWQLVPIRA